MDFDSLHIQGEAKPKPLLVREPGTKIPLIRVNYKQVGQWCETCNDVTAQLLSELKSKVMCLRCRNTKLLKQ